MRIRDYDVAIVTGSASGIGKELVAQLSKASVRVIGIDLDLAASKSNAANGAAELGSEFVCEFKLDVRNEDAIRSVYSHEWITASSVMLVIANAGVLQELTDDGLRPETARSLIDTNYLGAVHTLWPAVETSNTRRFTNLVAVTSIGSLVSTHQSGAYSASKSALAKWIESAQLQYRSSKIKFLNAVVGFVETPMTAEIRHAQRLQIPVEVAVAKLLKAIEKEKSVASIPLIRNLPWWGLQLLPSVARSGLLRIASVVR